MNRSVRAVGIAILALFITATSAYAERAYDLDFSLPTAGKSGCMVCHGDKNLVRLEGNRTKSYWVDVAVIEQSAHRNIQCSSCHSDFAYKAPHTNAAKDDWRRIAKASCKNCHGEQFGDVSAGAHTQALAPGVKPTAATQKVRPLCGDCHGGHGIQPLGQKGKVATQGRLELHRAGQQVCGQCHQDYWDSYDDYYHGAAYRRGAEDAPACWDCHGYHEVLPSSEPRSQVNEAQLVLTCEKCHDDINNKEEYVSYAELVHRKQDVLDANPLYVFFKRVRETISGIFGAKGA